MVVSVTVEGSAGPVKAMVKLGSSIREAIAAVVERYDREGRSPRLDPASADSFQLHHSHFCLESKPHSATTYYVRRLLIVLSSNCICHEFVWAGSFFACYSHK